MLPKTPMDSKEGMKFPAMFCCAAGITDKEEGGPFLLEAKQGDTISGNVSRTELARIVATALSTPQAAGLLFFVTLHCVLCCNILVHCFAYLCHSM